MQGIKTVQIGVPYQMLRIRNGDTEQTESTQLLILGTVFLRTLNRGHL